MTIWSCLRTARGNVAWNYSAYCRKVGATNLTGVRFSSDGHRTMYITPSRWQWHKFKDLAHFYIMVGLIPVGAVIFYANVFIGPAQLTEIPEGYEPKHWEYHKHPITRFLARYVVNNPQQEYEKYLHFVFEENEKKELRFLEEKIKEKMSERKDYQAYYYRPVMAKYARISRAEAEKLKALEGDM